MRHNKSKYQLNRFTSWRRATLNSLVRNLLIHQSIETTIIKARAANPLLERLVTLAKFNNLSAKRHAYQILGDHKLVNLLFNEIGPRFKNKTGGYTHILRLNQRRGDNAKMVIWELTEIKKKEPRKPKKEKETKTEEFKDTEKPSKFEEQLPEEKKTKTGIAIAEKPPIVKKPSKKFLGGLRKIFKKERDSL